MIELECCLDQTAEFVCTCYLLFAFGIIHPEHRWGDRDVVGYSEVVVSLDGEFWSPPLGRSRISVALE